MQKPVLRNPTITGALRAREAAAQTHSLGGVSDCGRAGADAKTGPLGVRAESAPRARETAAQTHRCGGISGYGSTGMEM